MPTKTKKRAPAKAAATKSAPSTSVAERILAAWPPLGSAHRDAFRQLATDEECAALGAKTKSSAVLRDALAWCKSIDAALRAHPYALRRYAPPRFVWLVECVVTLDEAVVAQRARGGSAHTRLLDRATSRARDAHDDLAMALDVIAAGNPHAAKRVADACAGATSNEGLVRSLRALADLADELGRSYDPRTRALVASVTLRAEDAHVARAAAGDLEAASQPSTTAETTGDNAHTDRAEGRVVVEMRFAKQMFDRVRARAPHVPRLVPGPGTRAVV